MAANNQIHKTNRSWDQGLLLYNVSDTKAIERGSGGVGSCS